MGCDRVQRIWRREGLKVPKKQRPRGRLWLNDGSCIRLRPERRNHVWSYDFVEAQTHDGRKLRLMTLIGTLPGLPQLATEIRLFPISLTRDGSMMACGSNVLIPPPLLPPIGNALLGERKHFFYGKNDARLVRNFPR